MIESSSSAESSFRELDEVFLQTQTRIWLGELLNTRLDEDLPLPDLLQDGEILFEVSKVVWEFLMTKCMELRHLKHKYGPFGSKKSSGRYRPYSNVDSFLKVCKILGLNGIDLFSPSDVVEKRDIRKVCICIRALSKKARSKQLSVPDFDMVTHSVTMPTDMVGVIRRSLESSQYTFSSSSSYSSCKGSKMKLKQSNLYAPDIIDDDSSSSDESDEAESRYMGDNVDGVNSDVEDSPEKYSISGECRVESLGESDFKCQCTSSEFDKAATGCSVSKKKSYHGISDVKSEERQTYADDVTNVNFALENDDPFMGDSSCTDVGENNYIADYLAFSDLMVHATDSSNSVVLDEENNMFDFFLNVDPQGATKGEKSFHNGSQRVYSDDEEMEVSSTTSMSSVLGRLLNLEFDNQFDDDDSSSTNIHSSASKELKSKKLYKDASVLSKPPKEDTFHNQLFDSQEAGFKMAPRVSSSVDEGEFSSVERLKDESHGTQTSNHGNDFCLERNGVVVANDNREGPLSREDDDKESDGAIIRGSDVDSVEHEQVKDINIQDAPPQVIHQTNLHETVSDMNIAQEDSNAQNNMSSTVENGGQENRENISQLPSRKHKGRPLLKTVVKGTAIAGVIFLLLHIRKSNANGAQERRKNPQTSTYNGSRSSPGKQQTRSVGTGIYPTEKLRL